MKIRKSTPSPECYKKKKNKTKRIENEKKKDRDIE